MKGKKEGYYKQIQNALPGTLQNFIDLPGSRFHAGKFDKAKTFLQCYLKHGEPYVGVEWQDK